MVKIISRGSLKPDDPIFLGGLETFSVRRPKPEDTPKEAVEPEPTENPPTDDKQEE